MNPNLSRSIHDMRTWVAAIVGSAELLLVRRDRSTLDEAAEHILDAANLLSEELDKLARATLGTRARAPAAAFARRRVVVADDDPLFRRLLQITLSAEAYEVTEATDGDDCLRAVARTRPALVVLDWMMPGPSGHTLLYKLKRSQPSVPVLVLTGSIDQGATASELGADALLFKPFSPLELITQVEGLLGRQRSNDAAAAVTERVASQTGPG